MPCELPLLSCSCPPAPSSLARVILSDRPPHCNFLSHLISFSSSDGNNSDADGALADADLSTPFSPSFAVRESKGSTVTEPYIHNANNSDDFLDLFGDGDNMAGLGSPYIKDEPDDHLFGSPDPHHYMGGPPQRFGVHGQQPMTMFGQSHGSDGSIDPSELTMHGGSLSTQGGTFTSSYSNFGPQQPLSFNLGSSGIPDDELLALGNLDETHGQRGQDDFFAQSHNVHDGQGLQQQHHHHQGSSHHPPQLVMSPQGPVGQVYSPSSDGAPGHSPFSPHPPQYEQFRQLPSNQQHYGASMKSPSAYRPSPRVLPPGSHTGSFDAHHMHATARARAQYELERKGSQSRSPLTPKTPGVGLGGLTLGTPESGSFPSRSIHAPHLAQHRHHRNLSNQWEGNSDSIQSYVDSPLSSPGQTPHHLQISDVLQSGKPASLPAKVENGGQAGQAPAFRSQEDKRRKRRESHNLVERRRRDNINERIQELSHLVPQHRLEDEKVRKHLMNNSPLSPGLGSSGISPPQATSLLAGGSGRRAAGGITTGIPVEDKDKGPNKGDILNGSVSWTRDLMWALHVKIQQESELADYIASLGGTFPFEPTEEEKRMRTELLDAMERNDASSFSYSRAPGSGLRVPKHTNIAGERLNQSTMSPQSLSPVNLSGGSRNSSVGHGQGQYSSGGSNGNRGNMDFKEEDEYGMDMT